MTWSKNKRTQLAAITTVVAGLVVSVGVAQAKPKKPMRVAVLEFTNVSSDKGLEVLGKGLQSMITTDLSKVEALTIIERERLQAILDEQKLGRSGKVDKKTAAKIGKLAGASHLLSGSYTVHGDTMRLDARFVSVKKGDVVLAEDMTGERDAFFELEKDLVKKLVRALGLKLAPKERAKIGKLHTADFKAFKRFSEGVDHFDNKRYQAALESLKNATKIDGDFNLARVTLDQYEEVVAKIRGKAAQIKTSERELAAAKRTEVQKQDDLVIAALFQVLDKPKNVYEELVALDFLIGMFNTGGRNHGHTSRYQDRFDMYGVAQTGAALLRRYISVARKHPGKIPLFTRGTRPPETLAKLNERFPKAVEFWSGKSKSRRKPDIRIRNSQLDGVFKLGLFSLDEQVKLIELTIAEIERQGPEADEDGYKRGDLLTDLAKIQLMKGDIDAASGALARKSAVSTRPADLERIAKTVENLGKLSKKSRKVKRKKDLLEVVMMDGPNLRDRVLPLFDDAKPSSTLLRELHDNRKVKLTVNSYHIHSLYFGGEPVHVLDGKYTMFTGRRTSRVSTKKLRYYAHPDRQGITKDGLALFGGRRFEGVKGSFKVDFKPDADVFPAHATSYNRDTKGYDLSMHDGRPSVSFIFGMHDIWRDDYQDPETRKRSYPNPTQGWAVRVSSDKVELLRLGETAPAEVQRKRESIKTTVVATKKNRFKAVDAEIDIKVKGKRVEVEVDGDDFTFKLPTAEAQGGYIGWFIEGPGFVELRKPSFKSLAK